MKNLFIILFTFCCCQLAYAQDSVLQVKKVKEITGRIVDYAIDNLDNIYLVMPGNQIKKLSSGGDSIAVYNDVKRYGNIYSIDVTNPLKVLVYFKDFSTIVVLDRLLSVRNTIDLRKQNILQVNAVTASYDNNIWLYDDLDSKIKKIDDNCNVLQESTDLRQALHVTPAPISMYDRDGQLYMYDPRQGLFIFDYYGAKKKLLQLLNYSDVQVIDKNTITARDSLHIVLYKPSLLRLYSFKAFAEQGRFLKINFNCTRIYCLNNTGNLEVYEVDK